MQLIFLPPFTRAFSKGTGIPLWGTWVLLMPPLVPELPASSFPVLRSSGCSTGPHIPLAALPCGGRGRGRKQNQVQSLQPRDLCRGRGGDAERRWRGCTIGLWLARPGASGRAAIPARLGNRIVLRTSITHQTPFAAAVTADVLFSETLH